MPEKTHGKDRPRFKCVKEIETNFKSKYAVGLAKAIQEYLKKIVKIEKDNNTATQ